MMINLYKKLQEDTKYKQILSALPEEEQKALQLYMEHFMNAWQTGVFDPLLTRSQDNDFVEALQKEMKEKDSDK